MTRADLLAVVDATFEHWGIDAHLWIKGYGFRLTSRKGHAHCRWGRTHLSVPRWALGMGDAFATYYAAHEACHVVCFVRNLGRGHNGGFKAVEARTCAEFGISLKFRRPTDSYPSEVFEGSRRTAYKSGGSWHGDTSA